MTVGMRTSAKHDVVSPIRRMSLCQELLRERDFHQFLLLLQFQWLLHRRRSAERVAMWTCEAQTYELMSGYAAAKSDTVSVRQRQGHDVVMDFLTVCKIVFKA
jgi:hypothetical protein